MIDRETLGRIVRQTWVRWARQQPNPKPHHLIPWEELDEDNKEVDRQIGDAIVAHLAAQAPFTVLALTAWLMKAVKRFNQSGHPVVAARIITEEAEKLAAIVHAKSRR